MQLIDSFDRIIYRLRISVTSACNLNCFYCHHEGNPNEDFHELTINQVEQLAQIIDEYNISEIKITGGEPLLHPQIVEIVQILSAIPSVTDISMTTNGYFLEQLTIPLKNAGLSRLNIGCDSINNESVKSIGNIRPGLHAAKEAGFEDLKINMVLLKGINETEVDSMVEFARSEGVSLQIIELIKNDSDTFYDQYHMSLDEIERQFEQQAIAINIREMQDRKQYFLPEGIMVELVKPVDNSHFCAKCHTLRITNDFQFQPCINDLTNFVPIGNDIEGALALAIQNRHPFNLNT